MTTSRRRGSGAITATGGSGYCFRRRRRPAANVSAARCGRPKNWKNSQKAEFAAGHQRVPRRTLRAKAYA
jgi:hypothetical protein